MIAEAGFPPVYPTNGMKIVTGALPAVPTGGDVVMRVVGGIVAAPNEHAISRCSVTMSRRCNLILP